MDDACRSTCVKYVALIQCESSSNQRGRQSFTVQIRFAGACNVLQDYDRSIQPFASIPCPTPLNSLFGTFALSLLNITDAA